MTSVRRQAGVALALCAALLWTVVPVAAQTSLSIEEAMRRAKATTTDARAVTAGIDEAGARVRRAQSGFWPRVDVSETVERGNQPVFVFGSLLAQRRFAEANFAIAALNHPDPVTNTRTSVALEQSVFDAGRTRLGVEAARLERAAAAAGGDAALQDLAFRAAQAFVQVLQLEATVRATDAAVEAAAGDLQRARARRDAGLATEADALAVAVHLAAVRQRQIAASGDLTVARMRLADAVGLPLSSAIVPVRPVPAVPADGDAVVRDALTTHPLLRRASVQVQLADNGRRAARAALLPTVGMHAGWEFNGATFREQQSSWTLGAEVRLNVFRGFADAARNAEAAHGHARATAEREGLLRRIEIDIRGALAQLAAARAREDVGRAALAQARESQRIVRDRYETGMATVTDVLRAAEATLDAESQATAAETDVVLRTVALDRALGRL